MAQKEKPSTSSELDEVGSGRPPSRASLSPTSDTQELKLSEGQCLTILKYAKLPAHLSGRLAVKGKAKKSTTASGVPFTLDELDELLVRLEEAMYRAKANEKQKVVRIVEKVSKLLGSNLDPPERPERPLPKKADTVFQVKITLKWIDPPIWRRIQTTDCTLDELHGIIQVAMGWEFNHLYRFYIGGVEYADLEMASFDDVEDAFEARLSEVIPAGNRRPRFEYVYDFGDDWRHQLIVEQRFPPEKGRKYPICVAGERACPPEDCGGPWGYPGLVEAIRIPAHRRHDELLEWVGGDFDPERFDRDAVNAAFRRLRSRKS
jgi:hypothetical protein